MSQRPFKILSIDGGGIKGLYSASILAGIEKENGSIAENFDMICGTSTGGIIALGLAIGMTALEIANFYETKGPLIFPYNNFLTKTLATGKQFTIRSKYSDNELKKSLTEVFGTKRMRDINSPVILVPAINLTNGDNIVFKTPHQPEFTRDPEHLLVDVALATSAAPTYFPIARMETFEGAQLIDGGIWANNPALLGIIEALTFYVGPNKEYKRFKLLSVGNVRNNIGWSIRKQRRQSIRHCALKLIETTMDTQSQAVHNYIAHLIKSLDGDYLRIECTGLSAEHAKHIALDKAHPNAISILKHLAKSESDKWCSKPEIKIFFN
ncbi:MAG: CBASS cGAMP-activated phospholipase [Bacillota bacterium]